MYDLKTIQSAFLKLNQPPLDTSEYAYSKCQKYIAIRQNTVKTL